jgi:hypothetical protein
VSAAAFRWDAGSTEVVVPRGDGLERAVGVVVVLGGDTRVNQRVKKSTGSSATTTIAHLESLRSLKKSYMVSHRYLLVCCFGEEAP